jgi:hypothetical protein
LYDVVNAAEKVTCDALGQWFKQNLHEDLDPKGKALAPKPMNINPSEDVHEHLMSGFWGQPKALCADRWFQSDNLVNSNTGASTLAPSVTLGLTMVLKWTAKDKSVGFIGDYR